MTKLLEYLKYIGIFSLFIIGIAVFTALINLTNINTILITKLSIIFTAISFFLISTKASTKINEKGYILGLKLGLLMIIILIILNLFIFKSKFSIDRFIYYTILLASSLLGGSFGKNLKIKNKH